MKVTIAIVAFLAAAAAVPVAQTDGNKINSGVNINADDRGAGSNTGGGAGNNSGGGAGIDNKYVVLDCPGQGEATSLKRRKFSSSEAAANKHRKPH
ncbi:hypothetical protein CMUS01_11524 [Colletotrichum musicola]|uniref:Uncharacterized protein n=1 Tax=Colletotrichum musicola TaxID=2175873 RepID=A0A8H6JXM2_9PEZI|nr:hypothetical protein CMUS01_11524 [Colletotrichum musicola]